MLITKETERLAASIGILSTKPMEQDDLIQFLIEKNYFVAVHLHEGNEFSFQAYDITNPNETLYLGKPLNTPKHKKYFEAKEEGLKFLLNYLIRIDKKL